ncbi:methionine adenosyltransferase 2 subunit beta [Trifolium pratense]|uniref:Methionine adenosyltransferase 2 subunit beta n=1 Tax=Trifolium pratense TaxID=57577 RepID=A0A2K3JMI7_TRIPR|nr:methionine adenosyltransferase 2 subunit beta [Trifolium pratense]
MSKKKILIVGGTGYLGQHLLQSYNANQTSQSHSYDLTVAFTYHSTPLPQPLLDAFPDSQSFHVDFKSAIGFESISNAFGQIEWKM